MPAGTIAAVSASPPDISAILTSLGVFSLAIAAVVGGIYKGIKEVKKGGADTGTELKSGLILETATARSLTESNHALCQTNRDILDSLKSIDRNVERLIEATQDQRETTRSQIEEQHRLRAATVDLVEMFRRFRI